MNLAQKLIDAIHAKLIKHNPIQIAHDLGVEVFDLKSSPADVSGNSVLHFRFPDNSQAFLIRSGPIWIGETL